MNGVPPVSPGELLQEEFLEPLGISEIIAGQRAITADTDLRLCRVLRLSSGYWLRAQVAYDTEVARVELADVLDTLQPLVGC